MKKKIFWRSSQLGIWALLMLWFAYVSVTADYTWLTKTTGDTLTATSWNQLVDNVKGIQTDNDNNVWIGLTDGGSKLSIGGFAPWENGLHIYRGTSSTNKYINLKSDSIASWSYWIYAEWNDLSDAFVVRWDGRVWIGTTEPTKNLEIENEFDPTLKLVDSSVNGNTVSLYAAWHWQWWGLVFNADINGNTVDVTGTWGTVFSITNDAYPTKAWIIDFDGNGGVFTIWVSDGLASKWSVVNYNKQLVINNNWNVWIWAVDPSYRLEVVWAGNETLLALKGGAATAQFWKTENLTKAAAVWMAIPGNAAWDDLSFSLFDWTLWGEKMTILQNWNIWIWTTTPSSKVHSHESWLDSWENILSITKGYQNTSENRSSLMRIWWAATANNDKSWDIRAESSKNWFNEPIFSIHRTDNTAKDDFVIDEDGNIWIWTSNPASSLHVQTIWTWEIARFRLVWGSKNPSIVFDADEATWESEIRFWGTTGYNGTLSVGNTKVISMAANKNVRMYSLESTYTNGAAYVCVNDSWVIYASEVACP